MVSRFYTHKSETQCTQRSLYRPIKRSVHSASSLHAWEGQSSGRVPWTIDQCRLPCESLISTEQRPPKNRSLNLRATCCVRFHASSGYFKSSVVVIAVVAIVRVPEPVPLPSFNRSLSCLFLSNSTHKKILTKSILP